MSVVVKGLPTEYASGLMHATPRVFIIPLLLLAALSGLVVPAGVAQEVDAAAGIAMPEKLTPTLPLEEVRVGMRGYGLSVFAGTEIEPFPFEVVSVVGGSAANRSTIWVVCTDERMQRSGPVQGMSGSPMYVWDEGEPQELGRGGRLIGAFAFGYPESNVCLVGVQPIEYMREVGRRALDNEETAAGSGRAAPGMAAASIARLSISAERLALGPMQRRQLDATSGLLRRGAAGGPVDPIDRVPAATTAGPTPMLLPLSVGDPVAAAALEPLLRDAGFAAVAGGGNIVGGKPPSNVEPDAVEIRPGSVLSIPLAYGDIDLSAAGTVTDVTPDGEVLAFGHAMEAVGPARLPMATGYTHFVVSRDSISFKQSGSLEIVGSVVRDEAAAVAGVPRDRFATAPVEVTVSQPNQPERSYQYTAVDHIRLTPAILAALANISVNAVQAPPTLHTMDLTATLQFTGGHTLEIDNRFAGGGVGSLIFELLPPVVAMMQNPFEPLSLESAEMRIDVAEGIDLATLVEAVIDDPVAEPGQTVKVTVTLQPFQGGAYQRTLAMTLPTDLTPGDYQLTIDNATGHTQRILSNDPLFQDVDNPSELAEALQKIAAVDVESIYMSLPLQRPGVAVDGGSLDNLPSSRVALFAVGAVSSVTPHGRFVEARYDARHIIDGSLTLPLTVRADRP